MEYSYDKLSDGIYYLLSVYPNQMFTKDDLLTSLNKENICPEYFIRMGARIHSTYFLDCCDNVVKNYKNVNYDGTFYTLKTNTTKYDFEKVEKIILHPELYPEVKFDRIYENGQTILHMVCSENKLSLLEKLGKSYELDFFVKNDYGQRLQDVIPYNTLGSLTMRTLIDVMTTQLKEKHDGNLAESKQLNTKLQHKNNEIFFENQVLKTKNISMSHKLFMYQMILFTMGLFFAAIYIYFY
jgi:hypothetical protein